MTSSRNNPTRADEDLLLDAARDRIIAVGLRRATLTDIARRAGVSRMTIYRRWPDMAALVGDVMTREWVGLIGTVGAAASGAHTRERLVGGVVEGVRTMRDHPMFRRIVDLDPEVLLPYLVDRRGASQDAMLTQISAGVLAGQADGSIRAGAVDLLAQSVLLTLQSFALSAPIMGGPVEELDEELSTLLHRYLAPLPVADLVPGTDWQVEWGPGGHESPLRPGRNAPRPADEEAPADPGREAPVGAGREVSGGAERGVPTPSVWEVRRGASADPGHGARPGADAAAQGGSRVSGEPA